MKTLGDHMRAAREAAGLSTYALADMAGISQHALWMLEVGRNKPRVETAILLADVLGISIDEYIGHVPKKG